jgi:hypothetical protein
MIIRFSKHLVTVTSLIFGMSLSYSQCSLANSLSTESSFTQIAPDITAENHLRNTLPSSSTFNPAYPEPQISSSFSEDRVPRNTQLQDGIISDPLSQLTKVSELRDVSPTDWAYEALRSLVERYGCIVGYPDTTFRGNRALSRYEFAAGLNACMQQIERLIAASEVVLREDLAKLQRLMKEFEGELAALGTRLDNLEGRVAFLEDNQFSTTTKLLGSVVFSLADVFGGDGDKNQTVLQQRVAIDLATSFSGKDLLVSVFRAGNASIGAGFDLAGTSVGGINIGSAEGTLSSQFGGNTNNKVKLLALQYQFPASDKLRIYLDASTGVFQSYVPTLNPYLDDLDIGIGSISVFGQRSSIYVIPGGGSGIGFNYELTDKLKLSAGYLADGVFAGNPQQGKGLFNGGYGALGQLTWEVSEEFSLAVVYVNEYSPPGSFGFNYNGLEVAGTAVANTLAGQVRFGDNVLFKQQPVITNAYGIQFSWQPSPQFALNGWFSAAYPRLIGRGDGEILSYAVTFAFPDLGKEGNLLGLVIGAEPYLTSFKGGNPKSFSVDLPLHIEAFYRHQLKDNISITPGFIWLTAPNQDNSNPDDVIATIRTTFKF